MDMDTGCLGVFAAGRCAIGGTWVDHAILVCRCRAIGRDGVCHDPGALPDHRRVSHSSPKRYPASQCAGGRHGRRGIWRDLARAENRPADCGLWGLWADAVGRGLAINSSPSVRVWRSTIGNASRWPIRLQSHGPATDWRR